MLDRWINIVRSYEYFNLLGLNEENKIDVSVGGGDFSLVTQYDFLFDVKVVPNDFEKKYGPPPSYIGASHCRNYLNSDNLPDSPCSKPAQRAGNMSFFWSKDAYVHDPYHLSYQDDNNEGLTRHRGDWWPASIEMVNIRKHYSSGELHRDSNFPAIRADYIIVCWYEHGNLYRANGPAIVNLRGYKEFWIDGKYQGYSLENNTLTWKTSMTKSMEDHDYQKMLEFVEDSGGADLFSNHYFLNADDEFCFISEFSSYD